jgi:hypothetical protein
VVSVAGKRDFQGGEKSPVPTANPTLVTIACESAEYLAMRDLCSLIWCAVVGLFRSRMALQAEILVLRHQLNVLQRKSPKRVALGNIDRVVLVGLAWHPRCWRH